jgi:hypothetical protein
MRKKGRTLSKDNLAKDLKVLVKRLEEREDRQILERELASYQDQLREYEGEPFRRSVSFYKTKGSCIM